MNPYNEDYYCRGEELGLSLYTDYHWLPEQTLALAHKLVLRNDISEHETVLDFGSAHGYLVKALRILGYQAFGCDVSEYAVSQTPEDVKDFNVLLHHPLDIPKLGGSPYDLILSRDVFEHIRYETLFSTLAQLKKSCARMFVVVPLAENGKYVIPSAELDVTHIIREDAGWWQDQFWKSGFKVRNWGYSCPGIKSPAFDYYARGYLFAWLES